MGSARFAWTAFKVEALSFGGGFVIVPLMQNDAVHVYHWMTSAQFLTAVALGQVTPGPVVATVAAVVAFSPSFSFILLGGGRFEQLRSNQNAALAVALTHVQRALRLQDASSQRRVSLPQGRGLLFCRGAISHSASRCVYCAESATPSRRASG